jgi:orotidine-5'-phosphate decarboxylase
VDQLLIALDLPNTDDALAMASSLRGLTGGFKIGSRLFTAEGPDVVRRVADLGERIFLDLKFHDIPNTVAAAISAATELGVWMVNVHASGGRRMMEEALRAAHETAAKTGRTPPLVIAVTVLTSMNGAALADIGVQADVLNQVLRLAELAQRAGLDGVVASPLETAAIRKHCGPDFAIVTPGVRGASAQKDDQQRTMSAEEALASGASYLVVGRPIIAAPDPRDAAAHIVAEMRRARGQEAGFTGDKEFRR